MAIQTAPVFDEQGARASVELSELEKADSDHVVLRLEQTGQALMVSRKMIQPRGNGTYYVPVSFDDILRTDVYNAPTTAYTVDTNVDRQPNGDLNTHERYMPPLQEEVVVPIIEEQVDVQKREVEKGRVRLIKTVNEREVVIDQPLVEEHVDIDRVPVNQMVDSAPPIRHEGDTMIIPVLEEVVVVEIRLMVREEIHVTRRRVETHKPQNVTLQREEVDVERINTPDQEANTDQP
jgi:uncharacterized protein (TIGR02271 family)